MIPRAGRYPRARQGSEATVHASLPEVHVAFPHHGAVGSEFCNQAGDNLADAGRLVFIGVARHGLGTIAMPFLFRSFHGGSYGD